MKSPREIILKQKIEFAIKQKKLLKFDYVDKELAITRSRTVDPTEATDKKLYAKDVEKGFRQFDLDGIQNLEILENKL